MLKIFCKLYEKYYVKSFTFLYQEKRYWDIQKTFRRKFWNSEAEVIYKMYVPRNVNKFPLFGSFV